MKKYLLISLIAFCGCTRIEKQTEAAQQALVEIEAAQMAGKESAHNLATLRWRDSIQLHNAVLSARAIKSDYSLRGKKECAEAFDSVFFETLRTEAPDLYRQLRKREE